MTHPTPLPSARPFPWFDAMLAVLVALGAALAGAYLLFYQPAPIDPGTVAQVRLTARPELDLSKINEMLDTPDYYVEVVGERGRLRTETFKDTKLGSGLTFTLPMPVCLEDIREVRVLDQDVSKDTLVDRLDRPTRRANGEKFIFELIGQESPMPRDRQVGWALLVGGGAVFLLALLRFVWRQAI